jgi:hypothetical protein
MANLDDVVRSAVPGGNIAKPLMIALLGLLASGALFKGTGAQNPAPKPQQAPADEGAGGLLGGLGGLLERFQQSGHGNVSNSWVGNGQNQPVQPGQLYWDRTSLRCSHRNLACPRTNLPSSCRKSFLGSSTS